MTAPWTLNFLRRLTYVTRGEPAPKPKRQNYDYFADLRALNDMVYDRGLRPGASGVVLAVVSFPYDDLGRPTEEA